MIPEGSIAAGSKIGSSWIERNPSGDARFGARPFKVKWDPDLCLGREVFLSSKESVKCLDGNESVTIEPGDFALMLTEERLSLPTTHMGMITLRLRYKALGLINVSGFHVDPGYTGHLIFAVYNAGPRPVTVRRGDPLFKIIFNKMDGEESPPTEKGYESIPADLMTSLQGPPVSAHALKQEVETLKEKVRLLIAAVGSLAATIIGAGIALLLK
jgi:dCTP deaminase